MTPLTPTTPPSTDRHDTREGMARNALLMSAATMVSRVTGLAREMLLSWLLGSSHAASAYVLAIVFPNQLRQLLAEGAMSAAFVPMLAEAGRDSRERAWLFARRFLWTLAIIVLAVVAVGVAAAPIFLRPIASRELLGLTVSLTRWVFPYLLLVSVSALLGAVLNYFGSFFVPAAAPAIFNTVMIAWALVMSMTVFREQPVLGFATGWLVAGVVQILIQLPLARRLGMDLRPALGFSDPLMMTAGVLLLPRIAAYGPQLLNQAVAQGMAAHLGVGYPAILNYAFRLTEFVLGGVVTSIATVILPTMSRQIVGENRRAYAATVNGSLRVVAFITIPASFALTIIGVPVVSTIFERGRFSAASTASTATALSLYCVGLVAFGSVRVVVPAFFALKDTWTPVGAAFVASATNVMLIFGLVSAFGFRGIPLALATSSYVQLALLLYLLRRKVGPLGMSAWVASLARTVAASAVMGAALLALLELLPDPGKGNLLRVLHLAVLVAGGAAVYFGASYLLRSRELAQGLDVVKARLARGRAR